ncbi:MAG TPA: patatin-like phospholipase family protein [Candidatus Bathyarchaeia archaeon]|nr:patatin-like phospholipase family protein [Candidatus Bathyarchaeia archaeon]
MPKGIVFGGGATLGDFQVGALKYLDKKWNLSDIACVCGTSIGALNATIVATGHGCAAKLEKYWLTDVNYRDDLIPQHEWAETVAPVLDAVVDGAGGSWVGAAARFIGAARAHALGYAFSGVRDLTKMFADVRNMRALYSTEKLEEKMRDEDQDIQSALTSRIALRLYATNLRTGIQTCFYNTSCEADRDTDDRRPQAKVLCESKEKLIKAALASAALPVFFPPVEVDGEWYVDGSLREVVPLQGAIDCGADHICAILCLPRLTHATKEGNVRSESADWSTSSLFDIRTHDFGTGEQDWGSSRQDVIDVANRTAAIVVDEITSGDLKGTRRGNVPPKLTVIDPLIPVHGLAELDFGLLKINADQGYMRAFDEIDPPDHRPDRCRQLTGEITSRRVATWRTEHELIREWEEAETPESEDFHWLPRFHVSRILPDWLEAPPVRTELLRAVRQQKRDLKPFVLERLKIAGSSDALPDHYEDMWLCWEHDPPYERVPLPSSPWDELDLGRKGTEVIPEECAP